MAKLTLIPKEMRSTVLSNDRKKREKLLFDRMKREVGLLYKFIPRLLDEFTDLQTNGPLYNHYAHWRNDFSTGHIGRFIEFVVEDIKAIQLTVSKKDPQWKDLLALRDALLPGNKANIDDISILEPLPASFHLVPTLEANGFLFLPKAAERVRDVLLAFPQFDDAKLSAEVNPRLAALKDGVIPHGNEDLERTLREVRNRKFSNQIWDEHKMPRPRDYADHPDFSLERLEAEANVSWNRSKSVFEASEERVQHPGALESQLDRRTPDPGLKYCVEFYVVFPTKEDATKQAVYVTDIMNKAGFKSEFMYSFKPDNFSDAGKWAQNDTWFVGVDEDPHLFNPYIQSGKLGGAVHIFTPAFSGPEGLNQIAKAFALLREREGTVSSGCMQQLYIIADEGGFLIPGTNERMTKKELFTKRVEFFMEHSSEILQHLDEFHQSVYQIHMTREEQQLESLDNEEGMLVVCSAVHGIMDQPIVDWWSLEVDIYSKLLAGQVPNLEKKAPPLPAIVSVVPEVKLDVEITVEPVATTSTVTEPALADTELASTALVLLREAIPSTIGRHSIGCGDLGLMSAIGRWREGAPKSEPLALALRRRPLDVADLYKAKWELEAVSRYASSNAEAGAKAWDRAANDLDDLVQLSGSNPGNVDEIGQRLERLETSHRAAVSETEGIFGHLRTNMEAAATAFYRSGGGTAAVRLQPGEEDQSFIGAAAHLQALGFGHVADMILAIGEREQHLLNVDVQSSQRLRARLDEVSELSAFSEREGLKPTI